MEKSDFDITILEGSVKLSDASVIMLEVLPGDKVSIDYVKRDGKLVPIIHKTETGKKLSKQNTFILKGKDRDFLLQYGDRFMLEVDSGVFYLIGYHPFPVYTDPALATEDYKNENYLDMSIIEDTNYHIEKFTKFEL